MKNTAIEELRSALNKNESNHDYAIATDSVRAYLDLIQAKHEEELKQAVVSTAIKFEYDFARHLIKEGFKHTLPVGTVVTRAKQYYEANFKTKEL
tara:strand:+ start:286 stop:570 length:285 start_codon:yes stop_codon:yes gene_type:complete